LFFVRIDYCALRDKGKKAYLEDRVLCIPDLSDQDEALIGGRYSSSLCLVFECQKLSIFGVEKTEK